ncbi:MAG: hypothetical protein EBU01_06915, partial [Crocinitomicaceae bacterium]|nr:hypothetical protein [Crocinitomicaceae bacterium]
TITGTTTVCQGSPQPTVTLTNSNSSAATLTYNTGGANSTITLAGFATQTFNMPTTSPTSVTYNLVGVAFSGGTGCSAVLSSSATVTVTAGPSATISGTTTVCQGGTAPTITFTNPTSAPITVTYNINSGTTDFTININGNTSNTVTVPTTTSGTYIYNLESVVFQTGSPCLAIITGSATVTVSPTNTVSAPSSNPTVCLNTAITPITLTTTGATGIGAATGLPTGVSASFSGNTITLSGTPTASGTFNYSIPLTGGCGIVNATGTITVRPAPTATISGTATVCQNESAPSITFTNPGLSDVIVSYNINGGATQTIAVTAGSTATVTVPTTANGTFIYNLVSAVFTNSPTCSTTLTGSATITVSQAPTATISGPTAVCQNATSPVITFTNPRPIDEIVTYTLNGVSATITVAANSTNTVTVPTGTATTYTYALVSVVYSGSGSCSATLSGTAVITVNPAPTATVSGTTTVCQGDAQPTIIFTNTQTSAVVITYNTGGANSSFSLPGLGTQGFNVPTTTPTTVTYNLVGVAFSGGTGCSAVLNSSATVTVSSGPTATISGSTTVCQGATAPTLTFTNPTSAPITVTYNINFGSTDFTINIAANSTNTVTVPTSSSGTFIYNLETVIFQSGSPCLATVSGNATVTISPNNTVSLASSNPTVCIGTAITPVTFTTTGAAGIGTPTGLPSGVSAALSGNTITVSGTPTQSGTFNYSIPLSGGCSTVNATGTITVNAVPTVTLSGTTAVCQDDNPPVVTFTNPQNQAITVTYSITGGPNANVNIAANSSEVVALPSTSAIGTFTFGVVSVSYQSGAACTNNSVSSTAVFTVNPAPSATISGTSTVCQNSSYNLTMNNPTTSNVTVTYNINGGSNQTATLTPGNNSIHVTTSATGTFSYNLVSVQYTSGSPCPRTISGNAIVTVNPSPTVTVTGTQTVCQGNVANNVVISNPQSSTVTVVYSVTGVAGTTTTTISGNNQATISNISTASAGTITYTIVSVAYTTGAGCINTNVGQSAVITVNPLPTVTSLAGNACSGAAVNYPLVSSPSGGTFTWYAQTNANVTGETEQANQVTSSTITDVLTTGAGVTATVTYIVRPTVAGCVGTDYQVIITVSPPPTAPITGTAIQPTCATPTGSVPLSGLPASGSWTVTASPGGATITGTGTTANFTGLAAGTYTFTVTSGCTSPASSSVIINA